MAIAIISDIHSNLEALNAVLEDIKSQGIRDIYCCGDLVGYAANPAEVVDAAMDWHFALLGNHDEAVLKEAYGFNPVARTAVQWTKEQLRPGIFSGRKKRDRWKFLASLPLTKVVDGVLYVHGSPRDPTMEYVLRSDCMDLTGGIPEKIRDIFSRFERLCIVGHTHDPGVITERSQYVIPSDVGNEMKLEPGEKYFVNVGSVGQPRDGDPKACYLVKDDDWIRWRRVEYNVQETMQKILNNRKLDPRAAERLSQGR